MKSIKEYFSRVGKSKGFGIQSPWAFSFVTEVIGEKSRYYAYDDIDERYKTRAERKKQKLYFRIANFVHGSKVYITDIKHDDETILQLCRMASPSGVVIIENIYKSKEARRRWEQLRNAELIGVTFDLYDFAVCFLDRDIFKQHYKLNF